MARFVFQLVSLLLACVFEVKNVSAEKLEFSVSIPPVGTQCYLENIAETVQGKFVW